MTSITRHAPPPLLAGLTFGLTGLLLLPLLFIVYLAASAGGTVWQRLWATRIPELLANTGALAAGVAIGTVVLGLSIAWLVVRYEFPGRRFWEWALVLPLAIPTYVLAYVYASVLGAGGPAEQAWQALTSPDSSLPSPHSFWGATWVMTLDTFPFVYLLARSALLGFNASFEEVARACGVSRLQRWRGVILPLMRPAMVAGLSLVLLYVVSDFGAVSILRYQTFTYAVYQQITGRFDHAAAAALSLLLVGSTLLFLVAEQWFRTRCRFYQTTGRYRTVARRRLAPRQALAATGYLGTVFAASFALPVAVLSVWSVDAVAEGALDGRFAGYLWNSAVLSALAATLALVAGAPLAYMASRWPTRVNVVCVQAAYAGYVLPGPVGALALLVLVTTLAPFWHATIVVLILAYVIHFLPAGLQSLEPALKQITPNLEEAARSLGAGAWHSFHAITLPLVKNGFLAAWILVFVQCVKELPATLLLRPVGFDTLAVRVWLEASEELYRLAAPSALLIVLMTMPAVYLLVARERAA